MTIAHTSPSHESSHNLQDILLIFAKYPFLFQRSPKQVAMGSTNFDQRLMCCVVDELAESRPEQLFCIQPISSDLSQGWRNVSMRDLAGAVDYTARWIEMTMGKGSDFEALAYIGANDIRYVAFYLACMKTGYAVSPHISCSALV